MTNPPNPKHLADLEEARRKLKVSLFALAVLAAFYFVLNALNDPSATAQGPAALAALILIALKLLVVVAASSQILFAAVWWRMLRRAKDRLRRDLVKA